MLAEHSEKYFEMPAETCGGLMALTARVHAHESAFRRGDARRFYGEDSVRTSNRPDSLVLGLSGGTAPTRPLPLPLAETRLEGAFDWYHDAAAVLVGDGRVLAAVEEERLTRLKHTNRVAKHAIRACLEMAGVTVQDLSGIAYYVKEGILTQMTVVHMLRHARVPAQWTGREYLAQVLRDELAQPIDPARIMFVEHHLAHASSAYAVSPFSETLVLTLDGVGDDLSGSIWAGRRGGALTRLLDIPTEVSLGDLYSHVTQYLGYELFDEYKVMGLAAYGDPSRYRSVFDAFVRLEPGGRFTVMRRGERARMLKTLPAPRRAGEELTSVHQDIAAAAQEALERAVLHVLAHFRRETGLRYLCAAGGVLHNSTLVGKIARSGLFEGVFVQPAASDAGCALGAAIVAHRALAPDVCVAPLTDVYWGPGIGGHDEVRAALQAWGDLIAIQDRHDLADHVAGLLAAGAIVAWVQGRSEFGPRALGNRSILADPRPAANKARINALVKHREGYRPFAPAVLAEHSEKYFAMPAGTCCDFMTLTVPVHAHARELLAAVTHVDGTARVQTVSPGSNPRFAALLEAFGALTGVPVLLNTSFNHSVEPIVQSVDDAVTCFLTTGIDFLVVGDFIVTKHKRLSERLHTLVPVIPDYVRVVHARQPAADGGVEDVFHCQHVVTPALTRAVSGWTCRVLQHCDGNRPLDELLDLWAPAVNRHAILAEILDLWSARLLRLLPVAAVNRHRPADSRSVAVTASVAGNT